MKVALASPVFHNYWSSIKFGLEQLGHDVTVIKYDDRGGQAGKLAGKIRFDLPKRVGQDTFAIEMAHATKQAASQVKKLRPDLLLVIKGDVLDPTWIDSVKSTGTRTALWLYDELRRTRITPGQLGCYDVIATYSPLDAISLKKSHGTVLEVPLAFDERLRAPINSTSSLSKPDVLFIGARYPAREKLLLQLAAAGLGVQAYGRDWSKHPVDRVRTLSWHRPAITASRDLGRIQAAKVTATATSAINIHSDQDGFTMRTFEVPGVGGLQLIDRHDVEIHYEPGAEVLVFEEVADVVDTVAKARRDPAWTHRIRAAGRRRTLSQHTFKHRCKQLTAAC